MLHDISQGPVKTVAVTSSYGATYARLHVVTVQQLDGDRARELLELLEKVIVDTVETWASA